MGWVTPRVGCPYRQAVSGRESPLQTGGERGREEGSLGRGRPGREAGRRVRRLPQAPVLGGLLWGCSTARSWTVGEDGGGCWRWLDVSRCPWAVSEHLAVSPGPERRLHTDRPSPGRRRGPGAHSAADSRGRSGRTARRRTPLRRGRVVAGAERRAGLADGAQSPAQGGRAVSRAVGTARGSEPPACGQPRAGEPRACRGLAAVPSDCGREPGAAPVLPGFHLPWPHKRPPRAVLPREGRAPKWYPGCTRQRDRLCAGPVPPPAPGRAQQCGRERVAPA